MRNVRTLTETCKFCTTVGRKRNGCDYCDSTGRMPRELGDYLALKDHPDWPASWRNPIIRLWRFHRRDAYGEGPIPLAPPPVAAPVSVPPAAQKETSDD